MRYTKVEFLVSLPENVEPDLLIAFMLERAQGFTVDPALGAWRGNVETAFRITVIRETDTPARLATINNAAIVMPAIENAVETWARNIAENLALEFQQEAVAFVLTPVQFELTTGQAGYRRNG